MEGSRTISKVIPDGELNCIWAEAGLVSYKLCDRNYECDDCPFDQVMRQRSTSVSTSTKEQPASHTVPGPAKQETLSDVISDIFGGPFSEKPPGDRVYSRGHVWVMKGTANAFRVGIDHYAARLLEGVGSMVFPQAGASAVRDNPCAWIICDDGTIAVQSPVDGTIRTVNPLLMESPTVVRGDPYGLGWLAEISSGEDPSGICLDASAMEAESMNQFASLKREIIGEFDSRPPALGVTLMDGGSPPHSLKDVLGTARYISLLQKLFLCKV